MDSSAKWKTWGLGHKEAQGNVGYIREYQGPGSSAPVLVKVLARTTPEKPEVMYKEYNRMRSGLNRQRRPLGVPWTVLVEVLSTVHPERSPKEENIPGLRGFHTGLG